MTHTEERTRRTPGRAVAVLGRTVPLGSVGWAAALAQLGSASHTLQFYNWLETTVLALSVVALSSAASVLSPGLRSLKFNVLTAKK